MAGLRAPCEKARVSSAMPSQCADVDTDREARSLVMAGLVPAIHVFPTQAKQGWMPGTRPGMARFIREPDFTRYILSRALKETQPKGSPRFHA